MTAADVEKFRVIFDLRDAGVRKYRQRMRRENPTNDPPSSNPPTPNG